MSRNSGSAIGTITRLGVTWDVEVNWYADEMTNDTEIESAYLTGHYDHNGNLLARYNIEMDVSDLNMDELNSLLVVANEDRADGYDDSDADRAYDNWKADQL
jgi:hypothetical protein